MTKHIFSVLAGAMSAVCTATAAETWWPQFRGPNGSGVSESAQPPVEFAPGTNQLWKISVPPGMSSPCVWLDWIFLTAFDHGKLETHCYQRRDGKLLWKTYTISAEAKPIGKNSVGTTRWGPSGGGVWSSPTVDVKRKVVYAATGNMYTEPQQPTSDAIMAFDLDTGAVKWTSQVTAKDIFIVGCGGVQNGANCPPAEDLGPDFDFGNAPILVKRPDGKDVIVAGQKSGVGWAFDPDKKGAVLWQYRAGKGSALGGLEFGSAVDATQAYFAVSDMLGGTPGGLHAVKLSNGERSWYTAPEPPRCGTGRGCNNAILAAISVIPGVVFTGSNDGAGRCWAKAAFAFARLNCRRLSVKQH
jgi:outer membrane protein assembly factor BamB